MASPVQATLSTRVYLSIEAVTPAAKTAVWMFPR